MRNISVDNGYMSVTNEQNNSTSNGTEIMVVARTMHGSSEDDPHQLDLFDLTQENDMKMWWAVVSFTCQEATQDIYNNSYACRSVHSECIDVNVTHGTQLGYRCKCSPGFGGNPYIEDGCTGAETLSLTIVLR